MRTVTPDDRHLATARVLACAAAHTMGESEETLHRLSKFSESDALSEDLQPLWQVASELATILLAQLDLAEESAAIGNVLNSAPEDLRQPFLGACSVVQPTPVSQTG